MDDTAAEQQSVALSVLAIHVGAPHCQGRGVVQDADVGVDHIRGGSAVQIDASGEVEADPTLV